MAAVTGVIRASGGAVMPLKENRVFNILCHPYFKVLMTIEPSFKMHRPRGSDPVESRRADWPDLRVWVFNRIAKGRSQRRSQPT